MVPPNTLVAPMLISHALLAASLQTDENGRLLQKRKPPPPSADLHGAMAALAQVQQQEEQQQMQVRASGLRCGNKRAASNVGARMSIPMKQMCKHAVASSTAYLQAVEGRQKQHAFCAKRLRGRHPHHVGKVASRHLQKVLQLSMFEQKCARHLSILYTCSPLSLQQCCAYVHA